VFVYVCAFFCVCVQVEALQRADHPSKESYRLSPIKKLRKLSPMLQKREQAPKYGSNEGGGGNTQSVGLLGRVISPSQCLYLHTEQHKYRINAHNHP
jgi:hypothetical protein